MPGAFHGGVTGAVWPAEDSNSPWTDLHSERQVSESNKQNYLNEYMQDLPCYNVHFLVNAWTSRELFV